MIGLRASSPMGIEEELIQDARVDRCCNDRIARRDGTESCVPCTTLTHSMLKFNLKEEVES